MRPIFNRENLYALLLALLLLLLVIVSAQDPPSFIYEGF